MHPTLVCSRIPICASLSKPTILCRCYTSRVPYLLHSRSCHYRYRSSQAKRAHTHHIDLYWVVFHLLQNFSARFFLLVSLLPTVYLAHERLMILNLACFKAFCSSVGRRGWAIRRRRRREVKPSNGNDGSRALAITNRGLRLLQLYFYHNYIYIDSCFSFPFIRFAVVPCSNVSVSCVLVCFFV